MWQKYEVVKLYDEEFYAVNHSETYLFLFPILMPQINIKSAFTSIGWDFNSISYSRAMCARWKNLPQYKNVTRKYFFFFTFFKRIYLKCETIYDFFFILTLKFMFIGVWDWDLIVPKIIVNSQHSIGCGTRIENLSIWYILHDKYTT